MPRPYSLFLALALGAVLLPLAACNRSSSAEAPEKTAEKSATGTSMPVYLPAYPGATVKARLGSEEDDGLLLVMQSDDPMEKVLAFYDGRAKEAGIEPAMFTNDKGGAVRIFGDKRSASGGLLALSQREGAPGTDIVITLGRGEVDTPTHHAMPMLENLR